MAPQWGSNSDPADPQRRGDQPEIAGERAFCPQQQMPGLVVEAVEIGKRRALLDDKDPLAEPKFEKMIRRQFDTLYAEGARSARVMAICLHPYLIGVPHRIAGRAAALQYIRSHDQVWFATGEEIVRHWLQSDATF